MRNAETTLAVIEDRGKRGLNLEDVYRQLFNKDLYLKAYSRLCANKGAMTKGTTEETVDGMSMRKIEDIIDLVRYERYRWSPVRRMLIPKGNGKTRPLGIPTWSDKLLQEVMRSILEAYYEPQFNPNSHGFRPGRGCHTALRNINFAWTGTKWFIEGDIKGCFDNIDHKILLSILREKIQDNRFVRLVDGLLKAGYLEQWTYRPTLSGTPQGGIVSPLLANIYLDKLDRFVETIIPEFDRGRKRKIRPEYKRLENKIQRARTKGADEETLKTLRKLLGQIPYSNQFDPDYRRLRYIRYADDFLLGFTGPKDEAEVIKVKIGTFLQDHLKLEMSPEKTKITHAGTQTARFLGYDIGHTRSNIRLEVPTQKIEAKIAKYMHNGKPAHRSELISESDFSIVARYGDEYRGFAQYYAYARTRYKIGKLRYVMVHSMLKTLAAKHRSTVNAMANKHKTICLNRGQWMRCFIVTVERPGKDPLLARFGGISLKTQPLADIQDGPTDTDRIPSRNDLLARLLADQCELCGSDENVQVHHIRKLADLKIKGRPARPDWITMMAARRRKTLVVCEVCHEAIHAGRPTRTQVI